MHSETSTELLITEDWLRSVGFKWHQFDRQPGKQWLLWIGGALGNERNMFNGSDDLGIELAATGYGDDWHCWLRSDSSRRYHRFIHIRHLCTQDDLVRLFEGLTGNKWNPENHIHGQAWRPADAIRLRRELERLDKRLLAGSHPWYEAEKDSDRGRPLIEHVDAAIKGGGAK